MPSKPSINYLLIIGGMILSHNALAASYDISARGAQPLPQAGVVIQAAVSANQLNNGSFEINGGAGSTVLNDWTTVDTGTGNWFAQQEQHRH